MRFGVDFRMLSGGRATVDRGMGRFTQQQLREVLRLPEARQHQFVLLLAPDGDPELLLPEIAAAPNVSRASLPPGLTGQGEPHAERDLLRHAAALSGLLADLGLDLFHATTPFQNAEPAFWRCDSCALVATHYDLIPLIYRDRYFRGAELARYLRTTRALRFADRLLAISSFARDEAADQLGIDRRRIDVAYPIAEPWFRPLDAPAVAAALTDLRHRVPLPEDFVLSLTHLHHAKNALTLLRAFAAMPEPWRRRHPLVVVGDFDLAGRHVVERWLLDLGIRDQTIVPGFVADRELAALYNACHFFVLPSRYEGFGMPALEAMRCGAPVIAAGAGAPAEVVGQAGLLVDPEDPASFARAFAQLDGDPGLRRDLRAAGLARAAGFTPRRLGEATLQSYRQAIADDDAARPPRPLPPRGRQPAPPRRLRLAFWGPLPPIASGISDYTAELLGALAPAADLELFVDDGYLPDQELVTAWPVFHYTAFERRRRRQPFDAVIYQLGASMFHVFMLEAIRRWPGVLVLHDLTLGYVHLDLFAAGWPVDQIGREIEVAEGRQAREAWDALSRTDPADRTRASEEFLGRHYMLRSLIDASLAQIVHLPRAAQEIEERYPRARVFSFPMGVEDPRISHPAGDAASLRRFYNLPADAFIVGTFGIADPVKRIEAALQAVARIAPQVPGAMLIVVGRFSRPAYRIRLKEVARDLGIASRLRLFEQVAKGDFYRLLLACDAVVNLRFPFRKQMSATLLRAIAAGRPVAVTDVADWDHLPARFCYRIKPDDQEAVHLAGWLAGLAADPGHAAAAGRAAREYHLAHGTLQQMADHYRAVIEELTERPAHQLPPEAAATGAGADPAADAGADAGEGGGLAHNKVCAIEDFRDPELAALIRDIFPHEAAVRGADFPAGTEDRKHWEIAMSVRALRRYGALRPDATLLGVGAGSELTCFYLTRHVARVIATDLYLGPGQWQEASTLMLTRPQELCPYPFESWKLTVQHMDGRVLDFPDDTFAGVFASGSIEHFGGLADVAAAAYEIGRVLAPGGVAVLSTEFLIAGPPGASGWQDVQLFDAAGLRRHIVQASGLEPVDDLVPAVSAATLATSRELLEAARQIGHGERRLPHLVLSHQGQVFCSVHLALRKTPAYPATDNSWARPAADLRQDVARAAAAAGERLRGALAGAATPPATAPTADATPTAPTTQTAPAAPADAAAAPSPSDLAGALERWDAVRRRSSLSAPASGPAPARAWRFLRRAIRRVRDLGVAWDREHDLLRALIDAQAAARIGADAARDAANAARDAAGAALDARIASLGALEAELARLLDMNAERQDLLAALHDVTTRQNTLTARLAGLAVRQDAAEQGLAGHSRSLLAVEQRLPRDRAAAAPRQDNGAHGAHRANGAHPANGAAGAGCTPEALTRLLAVLDQQLPALANTAAVEVSAHSPRAAELHQAAAAHLGSRLADGGGGLPGAGRFPSDAWLHVDLTPGGDHPILLENAAGRLARGGLFLLVTAAPSTATTAVADGGQPHPAPPRHPALRPAGQLDATAALGLPAQVLIWEKV